jgi:hypothetical protein
VLARLLEVFHLLMREAHSPAQQQALLRQGEHVGEVLARAPPPPETRQALEARLLQLRARAQATSREQEAPAPHTH